MSSNQNLGGSGWVYVIVNPAIPGLVKVGMTRKKNPSDRAKGMKTTGVPHKFSVIYAVHVQNPEIIEKRTHESLSEYHEKKEWFRCSAMLAVVELELLSRMVRNDEILSYEGVIPQEEIDEYDELKQIVERREQKRLEEKKRDRHRRDIDKSINEFRSNIMKTKDTEFKKRIQPLEEIPKSFSPRITVSITEVLEGEAGSITGRGVMNTIRIFGSFLLSLLLLNAVFNYWGILLTLLLWGFLYRSERKSIKKSKRREAWRKENEEEIEKIRSKIYHLDRYAIEVKTDDLLSKVWVEVGDKE